MIWSGVHFVQFRENNIRLKKRKKYGKLLNENYFEEDERRVEDILRQVKSLEEDLEDQYLEAELENLDFIARNIERNRNNAAAIIQRWYRKIKKSL